MAELKPSRVKRYRALIGAYHVELENLMRVLEALEQVGLKTHSLKRVTKVHDRAEQFLEQIEAGTFDMRALQRLAALFDEGFFSGYGSESAFETVKGTAVQQMDKTEKRWDALHTFIFEGDKGDFEDVDRETQMAAERETDALQQDES